VLVAASLATSSVQDADAGHLDRDQGADRWSAPVGLSDLLDARLSGEAAHVLEPDGTDAELLARPEPQLLGRGPVHQCLVRLVAGRHASSDDLGPVEVVEADPVADDGVERAADDAAVLVADHDHPGHRPLRRDAGQPGEVVPGEVADLSALGREHVDREVGGLGVVEEARIRGVGSPRACCRRHDDAAEPTEQQPQQYPLTPAGTQLRT
jgi:hypothetical protein